MNNPLPTAPPSAATRITRGSIAFLIVLVTLITYYQTFSYEFIAYDTDNYVVKNMMVHQGLTADTITWAFKTNFFHNWHPLTWLSYMTDMELWGLSPAGFRFTNVFIHIINTLLLFSLLIKLTDKTWESALCAGLFALHPLHIESVAWIAERKDVLSTFFLLLTIIAYVYYAKTQSLARYVIVLFFFTLGLMSKVMIVTLPVLLLLLDYWPLNRYNNITLQTGNKRGQQPPFHQPSSTLSLILEKIPLILLALWCAWMNIYAQYTAIAPMNSHPISHRIAYTMTAYPTYLQKTIWPANLAIHYPLPPPPPLILVNGGAFILILLFGAAWYFRERHPWFTIGWLWFIIALAPVSGLFQAGSQFIADRYTYIPHIGLFVLFSWALKALIAKQTNNNKVFPIVTTILCLTLAIQTWIQLHHWKNNCTLWKRAIEVSGSHVIAESNLASAFLSKKKFKDAKRHALIARNQTPVLPHPRYALGLIGLAENDIDSAITYFKETIILNANQPEAFYNLGLAYKKKTFYDEAIQSFTQAILLKPDLKDAYLELGDLFLNLAQIQDALAVYTMLAQNFPDDIDAAEKIKYIKELLSN